LIAVYDGRDMFAEVSMRSSWYRYSLMAECDSMSGMILLLAVARHESKHPMIFISLASVSPSPDAAAAVTCTSHNNQHAFESRPTFGHYARDYFPKVKQL
jgi:hypothetical protein